MYSMLGVYDIRPPDNQSRAVSNLPATFALFLVLSLQVCPLTIKVSPPPLYL